MTKKIDIKKEINNNKFFKEIPPDILKESQPTMRNLIILLDNDEVITPKTPIR